MPDRKFVDQFAAGLGDELSATLVLDTNAYASGDILVVPQEITGAFREAGGHLWIHNLVLLDEDDQGQAIDILFLNADGSIGTINSAVSVTDAVARTITGMVQVLTTDYANMINSQIAFKSNIGQKIKAASGSTSLYVAAVLRSGTPTYSASGIRLKIGVSWD